MISNLIQLGNHTTYAINEVGPETDDNLFLRLYAAADANQKEQLVDRKYMAAADEHEQHHQRKNWSEYPVYTVSALSRKLHHHLALDENIAVA